MEFAQAKWKYKNDPNFNLLTNHLVRALRLGYSNTELIAAQALAQGIIDDERRLGIPIHLDTKVGDGGDTNLDS